MWTVHGIDSYLPSPSILGRSCSACHCLVRVCFELHVRRFRHTQHLNGPPAWQRGLHLGSYTLTKDRLIVLTALQRRGLTKPGP